MAHHSGRTTGRAAITGLRALLPWLAASATSAAMAQVDAGTIARAVAPVCGSPVIQHCPPRSGRGSWRAADGTSPDPAALSRALQAARDDSAMQSEIVVTAVRLRPTSVRAVFERNLGPSAPRPSREMETEDVGAGRRCTVTRFGWELCSEGVDRTPGRIGP